MAATPSSAMEVGEPTLTLFAATNASQQASSSDTAATDEDEVIDLAALAAATYASLEESRRKAVANSTCQCEPWVAARARNACPDMRTCKYVRNVQAVQRLRERSQRTIYYTHLEATSPSAAAAAASASSDVAAPPAPAASSSAAAAPRFLSLTIPQCPAAMHSDAGWVAPGGGDATGNVVWPAALLATHILHAIRRRAREAKQVASQQLQPSQTLPSGFDDTSFVSLELGCGAALLSQYLALIDPPVGSDANLIFASDQNTSVWTELRDRLRVRLHDGFCPTLADDDESQSLPAASALTSSDALASSLQARLQQRVQILPYEWGQPLATSPALSCLLPPHHRAPDLLIGSDLLYFSIAYPKLLGSIWDLFENYTFAQQRPAGEIRSWMGKQARSLQPSAVAGCNSSSAAGASGVAAPAAASARPPSPLLFLCHKSRHAETEEDFLISLSSFAHVWQLRPEFVAHLQAQGRRTQPQQQAQTAASIAATVAANPLSLLDFSSAPVAAPSASSATAASTAPAASFAAWPMDPLPLDCMDPYLRFFFAMPRMRSDDTTPPAVGKSQPANQSSDAAAAAAAIPDAEQQQLSEWSMHLRESYRSFTPAPLLSEWPSSAPFGVHWLLQHFPSDALVSWRPDPTFQH